MLPRAGNNRKISNKKTYLIPTQIIHKSKQIKQTTTSAVNYANNQERRYIDQDQISVVNLINDPNDTNNNYNNDNIIQMIDKNKGKQKSFIFKYKHISNITRDDSTVHTISDTTSITTRSEIISERRDDNVIVKLNKHQQANIQAVKDTINLLNKNEDERMITWGDYPKNKTECRVLFQNTNGISATGKFAKAHMISLEAIEKSVDILCLAECNLDWTYKNTEQTCSAIFKKYWK